MRVVGTLVRRMSQKGCLTIVQGHASIGTDLGEVSVPFRVMTMKRKEGFGQPFIGVDTEGKWNGGRSTISPWVDEEFGNKLKVLLPALEIYKTIKSKGKDVEVTLDVDDKTHEINIMNTRVKASGVQLEAELQSEFAMIADELGAKAQAATTTKATEGAVADSQKAAEVLGL